MCRTVPISVAVSAAPEGTLWRSAVIVSASWKSVLTRPLMPRGVRVAQGTGQCNGAGIMEVMSNARSRRFPVTITQLPVTRCQICHRTIAYGPGNLSQVLTEHYRRAHPEALGVPSR